MCIERNIASIILNTETIESANSVTRKTPVKGPWVYTRCRARYAATATRFAQVLLQNRRDLLRWSTTTRGHLR